MRSGRLEKAPENKEPRNKPPVQKTVSKPVSDLAAALQQSGFKVKQNKKS